MPKQDERTLDLYIAVAIGGAIGALCREAMELAMPTASGQWPMATFLVNISGAFVLGVVLAFADVRYPDPAANRIARRFRPFVITGVLGGYTTFSTFMVETHSLATLGEWLTAFAYIVGSVLVGIACCLAGLWVGAFAVAKLRLAASTEAAFAEAVGDVEQEDEA